MNKLSDISGYESRKFLSVKDALNYYRLGRGCLYLVAEKADAIRRIGKRVLIDRETIDAYIDENHNIHA